MIDQNTILQFIKKNSLSVLSTVAPDHKSESAVMAYAIQDDFTFIMSTEATTRKYQNILTNPHVSIVVGGLDSPSLQIEGIASISEDQLAIKDFALNQHPDLKDYLSDTIKFFEIKTTWLRYSDFNQSPPIIEEIKL